VTDRRSVRPGMDTSIRYRLAAFRREPVAGIAEPRTDAHGGEHGERKESASVVRTLPGCNLNNVQLTVKQIPERCP